MFANNIKTISTLLISLLEISNTSFLYYFLSYIYLFMIGSMIGYILEVLFRRFVSMKRWINPGFLKGPYLPLYGFGTCILYFLSDLGIRYISSLSSLPSYYSFFINLSNIEINGNLNFYITSLIIILIIGISMTLIELIAGIIFIKGLHIKLWDYSSLKGNYKGIIAPLFSFIWMMIGALYFFFIHPLIYEMINIFNNHLLGLTFILGLFSATFLIDFYNSMKLSLSLNKEAKAKNILIDFEKLKLNAKKYKLKAKRIEEIKKILDEASQPLKEKITKFHNEARRHLYINNEIPTKSAKEIDETPRMKKERLEKENKNENINSK